MEEIEKKITKLFYLKASFEHPETGLITRTKNYTEFLDLYLEIHLELRDILTGKIALKHKNYNFKIHFNLM